MVPEPEFVLLDDEPTSPSVGGAEVALLKRSGRRGMRRHVLVDVKARRPHRRRLLLVAVALLGAGAVAVVVVRKRRARSVAKTQVVVASQLEPTDELLRDAPPSAAGAVVPA